MPKDNQIIVGTFRRGVFYPHIACEDDALALEGQQVAFEMMTSEPEKIRTVIQNASLHKYLDKLSNALNGAGWDQRGILSRIGKGAPIPWSKESLKALWKTVILARRGKPSTTKTTTAEMSEDYRIFDMMISEASQGVSVAWPCRESQSYEQHDPHQH